MYQEIVGFKNGRSFLFVIAAFVLLLLVSLIDLLGQVLSPLYSGLIVFLCFIGLTLVFYRYFICEFKYSVVSKEFVVYRIMGRREQLAARIELGNVVCLAPCGSPQLSSYKHFKATVDSTSFRHCGQKYVIVALQDGVYVRVIFQPSSKMLEVLKKQLAENKQSQ